MNGSHELIRAIRRRWRATDEEVGKTFRTLGINGLQGLDCDYNPSTCSLLVKEHEQSRQE